MTAGDDFHLVDSDFLKGNTVPSNIAVGNGSTSIIEYGNPVDDFALFDYQPLCITIAENDGEDRPGWSRLYIVQDAQHGDTIGQSWGLCISYVPYGNYVGMDYFTYRYLVRDNPPTWSGTATVSISVIGNEDRQNAGRSCPIGGGVRAGAGMNASVGEPVNVTNGNMWLEQTDYSLPGIGEKIEINRFYNSMIQEAGLFGWGWSTKYDERLAFYDDRLIRLDQPDGRAAFFGRVNTTDPFRSFSPDVTGQLVKNVDNTYTLTFKDGRIHHFSTNGALLWQKDRNGNQTTIAHDTNGVLASVTDAFGRTLHFIPRTDGTIDKICDGTGIDPCLTGEVARYEYFAGTSRLETVAYPDGSKFKFEYVDKIVNGVTKTYLATVKDALDNILETHLYDSQGRAYTSEKHGGLEKYTLEYTNPGLTTVTDGLGRVTKYYHTRKHGTNLITKTEGVCGGCGSSGSEVTQYFYDENNSWVNLTKKIDAFNRQTTYTYDSNANLLTETDILGTQKWTYNSFGQVLTYKDRIDSANPDPNVNTITNSYDTNGNLLTSKDALNNFTTLEYPATNNKGLPESIKDARNNVTKLKWFPASGLLEEIEDPYGKKTNLTYDARGRTKTVTNALNHVTQVNYFDDTQRKVELIYPNSDKITYKYDIRRLLESVTDERGKITSYEFDNAYRLTKITDPLLHTREFGYDLMSNTTSYKDPLGNITNYLPDDFNRLKEIEYPAPTVGAPRLKEKFEYDKLGRIKKVTDTANRETNYVYDDANRVYTVTNSELEATQIKYNQRFQAVEVKDAINQVYQFAYDPLGRLLSQTRAGSTMSFEYDPVGNRKKRIDYTGRVTHYTHDKLNRLEKIVYGDPVPAGAPPNLQATYGYDDISRLISAVNEAGTITFGYDNRNRVTSTTDVFGHTLNYEYELTPTVNQQRLKLDGAMYAVYNFDDANRLLNLVNSADSSTISFGYDNEDKLTSRNYPNGVATTYEYDDMDRLKRLKDVGPTATLFDRQYSYNNASQISQIIDLTQTRTFGYDNVDRLTSVTNSGGANEAYAFDDVGNRISSHRSATYGYQPFNKLTTTATGKYQYDANGSMFSRFDGPKRWTQMWDYENRLSKVTNQKQTVRYKYDALGRRVQRFTVGNKENTKFTYDGPDVLLDDNSGVLTKYLNNEGIDEKLRVQTGSNVNYFLTDHLGSTNGLSDNSGALTASTFYDSFGNPTNSSFPTRYQFTGREFDNLTGLHYYRARFYDPNLGRFTSEDPIGFGGGDINLYAYVRNQPLWFRDPRGLQPGADVLGNPNTWRAVGAAAAVAGAFAPPVAVAAVGAAAIYGAWQVGDTIARHPSNPLSRPWVSPDVIRPPSPQASNKQPTCQPAPKLKPFPWTPPFKFPIGPIGNGDDDDDWEDTCSRLGGLCLRNPWLPPDSPFGRRKPCGDCIRACRANKGVWDFDKCPISYP